MSAAKPVTADLKRDRKACQYRFDYLYEPLFLEGFNDCDLFARDNMQDFYADGSGWNDEQLGDMDAAYMLPSLRTRITADRHADPAAGVLAGNPVGQTEAADVAAPGTTAYLCGPPAMVDAARNRLIELGLPAAQIIAEQFVPTDQ